MTTLPAQNILTENPAAARIHRSRRGILAMLQAMVRRSFELKVLAARHRSRQRLAELDDHLLQDVGITREQALAEAAKGFFED